MSPPRRRQSKLHLMALPAILILLMVMILPLYKLPAGHLADDEDLTFSAPVEATISKWSLSDKFDGLKPNGPRTKFIRPGIGTEPMVSGSTGTEGTVVAVVSALSTTTVMPTPNSANVTSETGGMHVCTCLTDDNPRNANLPNTPKRLRWLHIPKTGTSFITTLWSYAASTSDRYIDLDVNSHFCGMYDNSSYSMYDFVLMRRYPWEMYGAQNLIPPSSSGGPHLDKNTPLGLVAGTQHGPLAQNLNDERITKSRRYPKIKPKLRKWGSEILEHNMTVAAFFRQPEHRIVSAYYDSRHASGFPPEKWRELIEASSKRGAYHKCNIDGRTYANPLECFARFPGIAGCMTRMLSGEACADGILQESAMENLPIAIDIIMNHLEFVGLTEDWNESICQFHRLFAGKLDETSGKRTWVPPLQGEFSNVHKSTRKKVLGIDDLHGFKDVADTVVYEAAKLKFERMVGEKRCYKYMPRDELKAQKQANSEDWPHIKLDSKGNVCKPMSCSDLGKQCGEWDDGCGKTIICGMCSPGRNALPSTWRVKCIEGQCIDYCPPWDEKGYWFLSDDSPSAIKTISQTIHKKQDQKYLSPVDAVRICEIACNGKRDDGFEIFGNSGLCKCGKTAKILGKNLTLRDFSTAHDLKEMCKENKARVHATLMKSEAQPICCPYINQKSTLPAGWIRMFTMGSFNLEGEYYDNFRIECGAFQECELMARQKQAELAVFDMFNSMCYLARNVVELESFFTITKDNQYRYAIDLRKNG